MIPEDILNEEAKNELNKIKEIEKTVDRKNLVYRANEHAYSFKNFKTIKTFGRDIYNGKIASKEIDEDKINLLVEIIIFKSKIKPEKPEKKQKKDDILRNLYGLFDVRERVLDAFEWKIFPVKNKGTGFSSFDLSKLKILTPKQMLQRLPIALAQVKTCNNSKNLLNEIRQIVYSLYQSKEITKKIYNNIIKSIQI